MFVCDMLEYLYQFMQLDHWLVNNFRLLCLTTYGSQELFLNEIEFCQKTHIYLEIFQRNYFVSKRVFANFVHKISNFWFWKKYKLIKSQHIWFCKHIGMPAPYTFKNEPFTCNFLPLSFIQNLLRTCLWWTLSNSSGNEEN